MKCVWFEKNYFIKKIKEIIHIYSTTNKNYCFINKSLIKIIKIEVVLNNNYCY